MTERIGIMGGTFDPIHLGHLFIAEEARTAAGLDRIIFIPAGDPPHKTGERLAPSGDRYEMVRLSIEDNHHFELSRMEIDRAGRSYTLHTLRELGAAHPDADLFFICGYDSVLDIMNWHEPVKIAELCTILTLCRPGYPKQDIAMLPEEIIRSIVTIDSVELGISSTDIRSRIKDGRSITYLVHEQVRRYIFERGLYTDRGGERI